jgi:hypothetical protein
MSTSSPIYGLIGEFDNEEQLLKAAKDSYEGGYRHIEAYTPYPVHGLVQALGYSSRNRLPLIVLIGGIVGCLGGFLMQYWISVIDYPLNVGGRPFNSWPSFIPVTFELTILTAALSAVIGMLILNKLPMPYHPVFNVQRFALATQDRFFLCIESSDPQFDSKTTKAFLENLGASHLAEVDH